MTKTITNEKIQTILKKFSMSDQPQRCAELAANLLKEIEPYLEKGIADADAELDLCSTLELILDEGGVKNPNDRVKITCQIYDHLEFPHFWKG
jgi:hypothetical protein